jgi:putative endonuclease
MTSRNTIIGKKGEDAAARFLSQKGYTVIARNVRTPFGELDLIAVHGEFTVFIEVKTRSSRRHGLPEEAITPRKKEHLLASAQHYLQAREASDSAWRIDVAAVEYDPAGRIERIEVMENAVTFS